MRTDERGGPSRLTATRWTEIDAARRGDAEAQRSFVEKYRPALVAYFARRGLVDDAEDVAQQVLLKLFGRVLSGADAGRGRFRSLLFTVASRTLASHLAARNAAARGGGQVAPLGDAAEQVPAAEDADAFDREWVRALLRACLTRLRAEHEHYHRAVAGTLLEGRPQREVAQAMGCSPTDVKNYVRRGRKKLIAYLREEVWRYSSTQAELFEELTHLRGLLDG